MPTPGREKITFTREQFYEKVWSMPATKNLEAPHAAQLMSSLVPLDDADNLKQARRMAQANLEAQAWNDALDIDDPPIVCKLKIHGARWGLRFQAATPAARGREVINEQLPPIPGEIAERETTTANAEDAGHREELEI